MPLNEPPPPDAMKRAFLDALGDPNGAEQLRYSLPVYALSVSELSGNAGPLRPRLVGWQFLAFNSRGVVVGEMPNEPDDPDGEITSSLTRGAAIDAALKASLTIREHPDVLNESFEFRRLRISALRIDTFWLKALPVDDVLGASDRVYPFVAFEEQLKSKLLQAPAFLTIVRKLAAEPIVYNAPRPRPRQPGGRKN